MINERETLADFNQIVKMVLPERLHIYRPPGCKDTIIGKGLSLPEIWEAYDQLTGESDQTLDYLVNQNNTTISSLSEM